MALGPSPESLGFERCRTRMDVINLEMRMREEQHHRMEPQLWDLLVSRNNIDFLSIVFRNQYTCNMKRCFACRIWSELIKTYLPNCIPSPEQLFKISVTCTYASYACDSVGVLCCLLPPVTGRQVLFDGNFSSWQIPWMNEIYTSLVELDLKNKKNCYSVYWWRQKAWWCDEVTHDLCLLARTISFKKHFRRNFRKIHFW